MEKGLFINMYIYIYMSIYTCEKLFTKNQSLNLALALQAHFLEWRLAPFEKELFIWTAQGACKGYVKPNLLLLLW